MTERKVINKYYPPDYDPSKIPKLKHKEKEKNRLWSIRVMAPFNMRCNTCAEYIYKGKKFNSRKETVEDEDYLGLQIHRFYIRCPRCVAVIAFKTDPQNCDYTLEAGASRNFEAAKTAEALERKAQKAREEEEANNPMKVLENRTKQSRLEMENIEILEELRDTNAKHAKLDYEKMISDVKSGAGEELRRKLQEEREEAEIREILGKDRAGIKRLHDIELDRDSADEDNAYRHPSGSKKKPPIAASDEASGSQTSAASAKSLAASKHGLSSQALSKAARFGIVLKKPTCGSAADNSIAATTAAAAKAGSAGVQLQFAVADALLSRDAPAESAVKVAAVKVAGVATAGLTGLSSAQPDSAPPQPAKQPVTLVGQYSDSGSCSSDGD